MVALIVNQILQSISGLGFSKQTHMLVPRGAWGILLIDL